MNDSIAVPYLVDDEAVLSWFKGKMQDKARAALAEMRTSAEQGFWIPGASRRCRAALNKFNLAHKVAHAIDAVHEDIPYYVKGKENKAKNAWHVLHMAMQYGDRYVERVGDAVLLLKKTKLTEVEAPLVDKAEKFGRDVLPAVALLGALDQRRPRPKLAFKTLSKTVVDNLFGEQLRLDAGTLRAPEIEWVWEEVAIPFTTKKVWTWVGHIKWPPGTVHGASKFGTSRSGNDQCEACGHAIKDPYNWVPILIDDAGKVPHSLWIGTDCARKMFDADVRGEAVYQEV